MTRWRVVALVVIGVAAAGLLIVVGRWEQQRAVDHQVAGMRQVIAAIGGRPDVNTISGFRVGPPACLSYFTLEVRFALQLCFAPDGHLASAVDRRGASPVYYSLEYKPSLSPIVYPPSLIDGLLRAAEAKSR
jgi:hypothetical protein